MAVASSSTVEPAREGRAGETITCRLDRVFWLAILICGLIIVPRALWVASAHSETFDEPYHLSNGLNFLAGDLRAMELNDPPLGSAITALPVWLAGGRATPSMWNVYYDQPGLSPGQIRLLVAGWKAILFLPLVGLAFCWCRGIYGARAGWIAALLLTFEPNFTAHLHLATLDALAVEGIAFGVFLGWRYVRRPSMGRAVAMSAAVAVALLLKHTAVILPGVIAMMALIGWVVAPWRNGHLRSEWRGNWMPRTGHLAATIVLVPLIMWALLGFERRPMHLGPGTQAKFPAISALLQRPVPGGTYLQSFYDGLGHGRAGHRAYLLGEHGMNGWWYYHLVVGAYKAPLGAVLILLLAAASRVRVRPRFSEWSLLLAAAAWAVFAMQAKINAGWRHFLPAWFFLILLSTRCCAIPGWRWFGAAVIGVVLTAAHALSFHPDYLSYLNFPRRDAYLAVNEANLDWGQSLLQVRRWLEDHKSLIAGRPVYLRYFGPPGMRFPVYLGDSVIPLEPTDPRPIHGLLVISPTPLVGFAQPRDEYAALRHCPPIAQIGHSVYVFDLDALAPDGNGFVWPALTGPPDENR